MLVCLLGLIHPYPSFPNGIFVLALSFIGVSVGVGVALIVTIIVPFIVGVGVSCTVSFGIGWRSRLCVCFRF